MLIFFKCFSIILSRSYQLLGECQREAYCISHTAWNYLSDPGFDDYRNETKLIDLLESYKKKYVA